MFLKKSRISQQNCGGCQCCKEKEGDWRNLLPITFKENQIFFFCKFATVRGFLVVQGATLAAVPLTVASSFLGGSLVFKGSTQQLLLAFVTAKGKLTGHSVLTLPGNGLDWGFLRF